MLRIDFSDATDKEIMDFLMHRDPAGISWLEHSLNSGFTVKQMMRGFEIGRADERTIDHEPVRQLRAVGHHRR